VTERAAASLLPVVLALFLGTACHSPIGPDDDFGRPEQTGDGWQTASVEAVGMEPVPLRSLLRLINTTEDHMIHSLLIVKDGKLVFEEYWRGTDLVPANLEPVTREFDRNTLHYVASVSKSITSALTGIALDRGTLTDVNALLFDYFPEHEDLRTGANGEITLKHLLSFSSGYEWNEFVYGFGDPRDSHNQMFASPDPVRYLLDRDMVTEPGAEFHYNSGDTNLMGEVVRRVSGYPTLLDFAEDNLFVPLGIDDYQWTRFGSAPQVTFASGGASLRPRDMAKLGLLYLDGGVWNGSRILSQGWIDESTEMSIPFVGNYRTLYGYGYNWWLGRSPYQGRQVDYFRAAGWGGQFVYVYPELKMVVVFTAGAYYETAPLNVNDIIEDYIFAAILN
jgi:CubicO group peptidase (beta-lactamase class C family)